MNRERELVSIMAYTRNRRKVAGLDTGEKILAAAMSLFSKKPYSEVTTKEIAELAGVSEMSLFRYCQCKKNLVEKVFERFVHVPDFQSVFEGAAVWELESDMLTFSRYYQELMDKNKHIILAQMKGLSSFDDQEWPFLRLPLELKRWLVSYFENMHQLHKLGVDPQAATISLMTANYGMFMQFSVIPHLHGGIDRDDMLKKYVSILAKGMG